MNEPIKWIQGRKLITPYRFDIMAKYTFVEHVDKGYDLTWAKELYLKHIEAFSGGTYIEPYSKTKTSAQAYVDAFLNLLHSIKDDGPNPDKSLVPVSEDYIIGNGAHRTAIASYLDLEFPCLVEKSAPKYNHSFFAGMFLADKYRDYIALKYIRASGHTALQAIVMPKNVYTVLLKNGVFEAYDKAVIYSRDIFLNRIGIENVCKMTGEDSSVFSDGWYQGLFFDMDPKKFSEMKAKIAEYIYIYILGDNDHLPELSTSELSLTQRTAEYMLNANSRWVVNHVKMTDDLLRKLGILRECYSTEQLDAYVMNTAGSEWIHGIGENDNLIFEMEDKTGLEQSLDPSLYGYIDGIKFKSVYALETLESRAKRSEIRRIKKEVYPLWQYRRDKMLEIRRILRNRKSHIRLVLDKKGLGVITKAYHFCKGKGFE